MFIFSFNRKVFLEQHKPYISQVPLQLGATMWLVFGQWHMGSDMSSFLSMILKRRCMCHPFLSCFLLAEWWRNGKSWSSHVGPWDDTVLKMVEPQNIRNLGVRCLWATILVPILLHKKEIHFYLNYSIRGSMLYSLICILTHQAWLKLIAMLIIIVTIHCT